LFESSWWDSYREIIALKIVSKLCFGQNNKKVGKWSYFIFNLFTLQIWENIKAKVPYVKVKKSSAVSQISSALNVKKTLVYFFPVGGSI